MEINNQYDFFKNVKLDADGNLLVAMTSGVSGSGDVIFVDTYTNFPTNGNSGSLYVDETTNIIYRYDGNLNNYVILNDPNNIDPDSPEQGTTYYARTATTAALNACTYNNGTGGVGATLTGNVNGVLGQVNSTAGLIDAISVSQGQVILVRVQADAKQNGLYEITQLGSVSTPFILTRIDGYNETSEVYPSIIFTEAGSTSGNRYWTQTTQNPVIGTNNLVYVASSVAGSVIVPTIYVDTVAQTALDLISTYSNGTVYPTTLPGFGANLRADSNGALGSINGVNMTSGMRILLTVCSNPAYNGVYTVTNAGSATQRWQLTRLIYDGNAFYRTRDYVVNNPSSTLFGSRYTIESPTTMANSAWGTTPIYFKKQNIAGLRDSNSDIYLPTGLGSYLKITTGDVNEWYSDNTDIQITADNGGSIILQSSTNNVTINGDNDVSITANNNNVNIFAESGEFNLYAGPSTDWYVGDTDGNKGYIKRTAGVGIANEVKIHAALGKINLSSGYLVASQLPSYTNDAAADADADLPSGAFYKLNAGRAVYQKP